MAFGSGGRAAALLACLAAGATAAGPSIQRSIDHLRLGMALTQVRWLLPPSQPWPSYIEPGGQIRRFRAESRYIKRPNPKVDTTWLGFKDGRLVDIQFIYAKAYGRLHPADNLAADWALIYGEPRRTSDGQYWWSDGRTAMGIFYAEIPILKDGRQAVELRTSLRLMDADLLRTPD
ncbi:MAG: hypothetical protein KGO96_12470 [Elusimicrobia bacterium]|nr:hypothetical protein [Elusimicrobiota bacterium]MDE2426711.1 hypothetical protein [Elusimicrobiota bacterium]